MYVLSHPGHGKEKRLDFFKFLEEVKGYCRTKYPYYIHNNNKQDIVNYVLVFDFKTELHVYFCV